MFLFLFTFIHINISCATGKKVTISFTSCTISRPMKSSFGRFFTIDRKTKFSDCGDGKLLGYLNSQWKLRQENQFLFKERKKNNKNFISYHQVLVFLFFSFHLTITKFLGWLLYLTNNRILDRLINIYLKLLKKFI